MDLEKYINKEREKETEKKTNNFVQMEGENVVEPTLYSMCLGEKYQFACEMFVAAITVGNTSSSLFTST